MRGRLILALAALYLACFSTGCLVVVTPMITRTRAPGVSHKTLHLEFLHEGVTTRAELMAEVGDFDTHILNAPQAFWARWEESNIGWVAGTVNASDGGRKWNVKNLIATFDEAGILLTYKLYNGDAVIPELARISADIPQAQQAPEWLLLYTIHKKFMDREVTPDLEVATSGFRYTPKPRQVTVTAPFNKLLRVKVSGAESTSPKARQFRDRIRLQFEFAGGTALPRTLRVFTTPEELWQFVQMARAAGVDLTRP